MTTANGETAATEATVEAVEPPETVNGMPLLRFRAGSEDDFFEEPVTIVGKVVGVNDDVVTISLGRDSTTQLYVEDLYDLLGGPEDALGLLIDAAEHGDTVKIHLTKDALTYENDKQLERYA